MARLDERCSILGWLKLGWLPRQRARSSAAKGAALQMWMGHRAPTSAQDLTHSHLVILEGR